MVLKQNICSKDVFFPLPRFFLVWPKNKLNVEKTQVFPAGWDLESGERGIEGPRVS